MEYSPPPFFRQGPSALARLMFFAVLAVTLLIADSRFNALGTIRRGIGMAIYPLQRLVLVPRDSVASATDYVSSINRLQHDNDALEKSNVLISQKAIAANQMQAENAELRRLLGERERLDAKVIAAEVLYDARDPIARKIVIDRGSADGAVNGAPVIDDMGVIGQATRVFQNMSEVTLLTDRDQSIAVQNLRSGVRGVAYGGAEGGMLDLRFMAGNADVQKGDVLATSGLDGVFPVGLPVARVWSVERNATYAFARILCEPLGGVARNRHVLLVVPAKLPPPPPPAEPVPDGKRGKKAHA